VKEFEHDSLLSIHTKIHSTDIYQDTEIWELYEVVQYYPGCIQRLYLCIPVALELGIRKIVPIGEILEYLSDMTSASQDIIRTLFLRHNLLAIFTDYLPEELDSDTERKPNFPLNCFAPMNRM
jgi:hypothetical protein